PSCARSGSLRRSHAALNIEVRAIFLGPLSPATGSPWPLRPRHASPWRGQTRARAAGCSAHEALVGVGLLEENLIRAGRGHRAYSRDPVVDLAVDAPPERWLRRGRDGQHGRRAVTAAHIGLRLIRDEAASPGGVAPTRAARRAGRRTLPAS